MATIPQLETALRNADKAGDMDAARKLAAVLLRAKENPANAIPDTVVGETMPDYQAPSAGQQVVGAGEAALTLATGATGGTVGMIGGTLKGLAEQILSGSFGTQEARRMVEQSAMQGAQALTYAPRGQAGQEQVQAIGGALQNLPPVVPAVGPAGGIIASMPAVTGAIGKVAAPVAKMAAKLAPAEKVAAEVVPEISGEKLGSLIKKASGGTVKAQEELAALAKINPEAKAAADRLGIELPADVFSDSPLIREAAGLTRSVAGTEPSAQWRDVVTKAADRADELMRTMDASQDVASVSDNVIGSLTKTREGLATASKNIYEQVDAQVPKSSTIQLPKLRETLEKIKTEVGNEGLSAPEKSMLKMLDTEQLTYGRLAREKSLIGKAIEGKDSPYGNMEAGALKRLYAALAEDQLTNVAAIGGEELRNQLRGANILFSKQRALEKRIVNSFGKEAQGSIASLMQRAITSGSKGDAAPLNKLLKVVPPELQKETVMTALMSTVKAKGGSEKGGFGFSEFSSTYRGLRENAPIYAQVAKVIGPDSSKMLQDLYSVSKRISDARANVLTTGKANQALVSSLRADNLIEKVLASIAGKAIVTGTAAAGGGSIGGAAASLLTSAMTNGKKDAIQAAGKLFASDEFKSLAVKAATNKQVPRETIIRVAKSPVFKNYANKVRIPQDLTLREEWITSALGASEVVQQTVSENNVRTIN